MIGIGTFIGFILIYSFFNQTNLLILIACLFTTAGFIAQARLKLNEHVLKEVLLGFSIGVISQSVVFSTYFF